MTNWQDWIPAGLVAVWAGIAGYAVLLKSRKDLSLRSGFGSILYSASGSVGIYAGCMYFIPTSVPTLPLALSILIIMSNRWSFDDVLRFFLRGLGDRIDGADDDDT